LFSFDAEIQGHNIFPLKKKTDWSCCANMDATNEEDLF